LLYSRSGVLDAVEPFDFEKSLMFLRGFGPMSGDQAVGGGRMTKAIMVEGQTVGFRVKADGPRLKYDTFSERALSESVADAVAGRISFFLSLEDDLGPFYSIAEKQDRAFYPLVERMWGLHHVKFPTLLEIGCWALINQRMQRQTALRSAP